MGTPSAYTTIVSPRSRRLRTTGVVLLAAICAMVLYGYFGLMPSLGRSVREGNVAARRSAGARLSENGGQDELSPRVQRIRKYQVAVALAYWGVCALLLVAVLLVAWLDLREVSRQYIAERREIWRQAAGQIEKPDDSA